MNELLSANPAWRGISIHSPKAGSFVANGYLTTIGGATELSDYLAQNFSYLDRLENQVVVEEILTAQITAMISTQNVGSVTFVISNGNVILSGKYNEHMKERYLSLVKEMNQIKGVTSVKNIAIPVTFSHTGIDITGQYVVTGYSEHDGRGFSVVMNGKIYTLGELVDGMKLLSIEPTSVQLEKDGLKYRVDYIR